MWMNYIMLYFFKMITAIRFQASTKIDKLLSETHTSLNAFELVYYNHDFLILTCDTYIIIKYVFPILSKLMSHGVEFRRKSL